MPERFLVTAQQSGDARTETLGGREHVVFPAVLVREQVLRNNLGATFLPAEEIEASADAWNGVDVVIRHPMRNGEPISARDPGVLNVAGVGRLFGVNAEDGALKSEVWIDLERAEDVEDADEVLNVVNSGKPAELSTGFAAIAENKSGTHDGEDFELILRDIRPDHLALLVEEKGACSVSDGCGLGVNAEEEDADMDEAEAQNVAQRIWAHMKEMIHSEAEKNEATHEETPQEGDMNREEMLDALCECEDVAFRRETLEAMNYEELAAVANQSEVGASEEPEGESVEGEAEKEPTPEPADNADEAPAWAKPLMALPDTVNGLSERMDALEEQTEPARNQTAEERDRLVSDIAANSEFEENELQDRPLVELRKLHKATSSKPASFIGLGGPRKSDPAPGAVSLGFEPRSTLATNMTEEN